MKKLLTALLILFMTQGAWAGERFTFKKINTPNNFHNWQQIERLFLMTDTLTGQEYFIIDKVTEGIAITKLEKGKK